MSSETSYASCWGGSWEALADEHEGVYSGFSVDLQGTESDGGGPGSYKAVRSSPWEREVIDIRIMYKNPNERTLRRK